MAIRPSIRTLKMRPVNGAGRFRNLPRRFARNCGGAVIVMVALVLPILLGVTGLAVDASYWFTQRGQLQLAADNAAMAATQALMRGATSTATLTAVASRTVTANGFASGPNTIVAVTPDTTNKVVAVSLTSQLPTFFSQVFGVQGVSTSAQARAKVQYSMCVLALKGSGTGLSVSGSAGLAGKKCSVKVNSTASGAASVTGAGSVTAASVCVAGTATGQFTPAAQNGCGSTPDPYAGLTPQAVPGCTWTNFSATGNTANLTQGIYCGGIDTKSATSVTFAPGIYVIKDGPFTSSAASITGTGVTLYFTGTNAYLNVTGTPDITLSAPTTGISAGILFAGDPNLATEYTHTLKGNTKMDLDGAIYLPSGNLSMTGNAGMTMTGKSLLIVGRLTLGGNSATSFVIDPNASTTMKGGAPVSVALIQ